MTLHNNHNDTDNDNHNNPSSTIIDYATPTNFFVFLVGHCEEWPENRPEQGDIALYNEYLAAGVPPNQVCFLQDNHCTRTHCLQTLQQFLREKTRPGTTLVFYYGGHAVPMGFQTIGGVWQYAEVCQTIDKLFQGERVLFLLDCCAAGNLSHSIPSNNNKQYVCLANSPPFVRAADEGDEWILSNGWLQGMRCKNTIPLQLVIEWIADRLALMLGNQFFAYTSRGVDCKAVDWMPRYHQQSSGPTLEWPRLEKHIPVEGRVTSEWSVGDPVFYKHPGGVPTGAELYIPHSWLLAYILDGSSLNLRLQVEYPSQPPVKWIVEAPREELLNDFYMAQTWMLPDHLEEAQVKLAKSLQYIDCSWPPNTKPVLQKNDNLLRVLDWKEYPWHEFAESDQVRSKLPLLGGCVAVCEVGEKGNKKVVPVPELGIHRIDQDNCKVELERQALIQSIQSAGKSICNAETVLKSRKLVAFWPEDGEWYEAEPLDPDSVSLEILATHARFTITGMYCPLAYEDGESALSPLHYVRKRKSGCRRFLDCFVEALGDFLIAKHS